MKPKIHVHVRGMTVDVDFDENKHPRKDNGQFGQGSTSAKPAKREFKNWTPEDLTNKTGNLKRSPFSKETDWFKGTGALQQGVKNLSPAWVKGQPLAVRKEELKTWSKSIPVKKIEAKKILATQWNIQDPDNREYKPPLFSTIGGDHPVVVELPDGSLHAVDGHHRIDAAAAKGEALDVKVIKLHLATPDSSK